jgi:single-strand DNA-binding protein
MLNKVTLIGRLGKDPEVRHFDNNSSVCNFSLATNETYTDKDGKRIEQTEWHNIAIWRKGLVDVAEKFLKKGSLIYAEGKLRTRSWDDQDGNKKYTTEIVVDNFKMLDRKEDGSSGGSSHESSYSAPSAPATSAPAPGSGADIEDDLPF